MPVGPIQMTPAARLQLEISAALGRIGLHPARNNTNPPMSGCVFRDVRGGVEVFYIDTQRRPEMQTAFVERVGPLLLQTFGQARVSRKSRGGFLGFKVALS